MRLLETDRRLEKRGVRPEAGDLRTERSGTLLAKNVSGLRPPASSLPPTSASGLSFSLFLLFASVAIAQPPTIVDLYVGDGGTVAYLDSPFDAAADRLCSQMPGPWDERNGVPAAYNNQPDGEGSDQQVKYLATPKNFAVFASGYALHIPAAVSPALMVERAGVRSQPYYWHRPRIHGIHGRTNWPAGRMHVWGHHVGGRHFIGGRSSVYLRADHGTMYRCQDIKDPLREMEQDFQTFILVVLPGHVPLGKYHLVLHANVGQQWGWSDLEPVEVVAKPVKTDVVQVVSPTIDGSSAWQSLNAAVQAAGPGGTLRLLPGDYYFTDQKLVLLPGQTITGKGAWIISSTIVAADDCTIARLAFTGGPKHVPVIGTKVDSDFAERIIVNECHFEWVQLRTFGRGWQINECTFLRSGLFYSPETLIKGCTFRGVGSHHACNTWGSTDSVLSENRIDGADRGFVQMFHRGSVAGNLWYRNEIHHVNKVSNGDEHFLIEGTENIKTFGGTTQLDDRRYQFAEPVSGFAVGARTYAVKRFSGGTLEHVPVAAFERDDAGALTVVRLRRPFRSPLPVPIGLCYGFFDNTVLKTRMANGLGSAVYFGKGISARNTFANLVSFGPMDLRSNFGSQNRYVDCELHGFVRLAATSGFNLFDGLVINDPQLSGRNQFSFDPVEREIKANSPVMESLGPGNAILRAAAVRPGGMTPAAGFDFVGQLHVVGE